MYPHFFFNEHPGDERCYSFTMNTKLHHLKLPLAFGAAAVLFTQPFFAADTNALPARIGIYDSRAVSYAYFSSEAQQRQLTNDVAAAKQAKADGQTERFQQLSDALKNKQEHLHLLVFSTAPADEAMLALQERLPAILQQTGVSRLISKWDETALKQYPKVEKVDVTDLLAGEFKPDAAQLKVIAGLKKSKPVSLDEIKKMGTGH